jgi:limonene 1,2-monooxygenase
MAQRMKFGVFLPPFHPTGENPTLAWERDFQTLEKIDALGYDEGWVGEHHSGGWETITSPEVFLGMAAARTKHLKLGTGVVSLPYHHPLMVADRMVMLDHITRGRVMFGVGPGAQVLDALMMGLDPSLLRERMNEALGVIKRLFTEHEPVTHHSDWFTLENARLQVRPYTQPHMPIFCAAIQSPSGMVAAGQHGTGILTVSVPRGSEAASLGRFWKIAEETADKHGHVMDRNEWRLVLHVHLADSKKDAISQIKHRAGRMAKEYGAATSFLPEASDVPQDEVAQRNADSRAWCVGTPDDLIARIKDLQEQTGGFGGFLVLGMDWADTEHLDRSYELIARYVIPHFQGSLASMDASLADTAKLTESLRAIRQAQLAKAEADYANTKEASPTAAS